MKVLLRLSLFLGDTNLALSGQTSKKPLTRQVSIDTVFDTLILYYYGTTKTPTGTLFY